MEQKACNVDTSVRTVTFKARLLLDLICPCNRCPAKATLAVFNLVQRRHLDTKSLSDNSQNRRSIYTQYSRALSVCRQNSVLMHVALL